MSSRSRFSLLIPALASVVLVPAQTLESTLARLDQASGQFRSLSAKVSRSAYTAVVNETNTETGTMLVKRAKPKELRALVDLDKPDQKTVAISGRKVEIYYPKMQTVQEYDLGKQKALVDQFFLIGFGTSGKDLQAAYTLKLVGADTIAGQKSARLELIPKSSEVLQHLKRLELWISESNALPVQQKFYLPGGDYSLVTYSGVKLNPDLPDSALKLNLPKGVKREFPQKQ